MVGPGAEEAERLTLGYRSWIVEGRPLSRTMIVEHVWDMDYDGLTNIVDVYIRHLRSKIDDRFPQKLIQTVRGIGYMIEAPDKPADRTSEQPARQV